jgi:asparagine synthase (glutamine-hydrolysing)
MCGIAGVISSDRSHDVREMVERLTAALAHRGPDGSGHRFLGGRWAAFGHRRLSIVDLECGAQPMSNEDGRIWVVLNGELYNHLDLRPELERAGHVFRTRSDTEVLVHGWEEWGRALLERLNGMYAFALYDGRSDPGIIWLARDPAGVKPLYVGRRGTDWWFASELAAARSCGLVVEDVRPEAVDEYLVYRFIPSPGTFFRSVWKVPPGHSCRLPVGGAQSGQPVFEPFTTRFAPATLPRGREEWEEALRSGLTAAVRRQLMSDVPVGSLLSGGVDSTVVTRLMQDALPQPPQTFAVGFAGAGEADEIRAARRAAVALRLPLAEVSVTEDQYLASWPSQIASLGEPIANSGVLLVGLLCRLVRETHKVVLTGQGADELLGGYPRHAAERWYRLARRMRPLLSVLPESGFDSDRLARMRRLAATGEEARRFAETLAVFSPTEAVALTGHVLDPEELIEPVRRLLPKDDTGDSINRLLQVDARLSLADDLLIVADHMSMASSVELRVPFLDLEFQALVERMPGEYKVSRLGERKVGYRRAVAPLLPPSLRSPLLGWRARFGRKLGFTAPLEKWFGRWVSEGAARYLLGPEARIAGMVRTDRLRDLLAAVRHRGLARTRQLMNLYVLETWLRAGDGGAVAGAGRQQQ